MSFFGGSGKSSNSSSQKAKTPQSSSNPPSRANSIKINDHQFLQPDTHLIHSVSSGTTGTTSVQPSNGSHGFPQHGLNPGYQSQQLHQYGAYSQQPQPEIHLSSPTISGYKQLSPIPSYYSVNNVENHHHSAISPPLPSVAGDTISIPLTTTSSNFFERERINSAASVSSTTSGSFYYQNNTPSTNHGNGYGYNMNSSNYPGPPQNNPSNSYPASNNAENNGVMIDENLFEDLDYNQLLDVYWDALDAPEDAYLNITLPNTTTSNNFQQTPYQTQPLQPPQQQVYNQQQRIEQEIPQSIQLPHQQRLNPATLSNMSQHNILLPPPHTPHTPQNSHLMPPPNNNNFYNNLNNSNSNVSLSQLNYNQNYPQMNNSNYSNNIIADDRPTSYRKHKREEMSSDNNDGSDENHHPGQDDDESEEGIKAMRYGSLGRIIASTVAASSLNDRKLSITEKTPEQKEEYRKDIINKFMKFLNQSNMNGLAKLIREKFSEICLLITPEVFEPISGRADVMIMFSLLLETYPDSVWTVLNTTVSQENDTITCLYLFKGTKLFTYPLSSLFRQIKTHISKLSTSLNSEGNEEISSTRLVNEVADYIHVNPTSMPSSIPGHHQIDLALTVPPLTRPGSFRQTFDDPGTGRRSESSHGPGDELMEAINIPRRDQTLREVKSIETAVLKEGATTYRRKIDFVFNDMDQIIRVVVINVIS